MQTSSFTCFFFFLILARALEHAVCFGDSRLSQVNNSSRVNVFLTGEANFGQAMYQSLERSTQDTRDRFDLYSALATFAWNQKTRSPKTTAKLIQNNVYCFFITIFRLAIPAFFTFTDVTELM